MSPFGTDARSMDSASGACLHGLVFQDMPGVWMCRGLEHDILTEARTIGEALRDVVRLITAHTAYDERHRRAPLSAFGAAPPSGWYWFTSGTPVTFAQLGIEQPGGWHVVAAIAHRRPMPIPRVRAIGAHAIA
jgi:hypothetical protein